MTRSLAHRGPDGEGLYVDGSLGLGHRRLAILDLSEAGKQPMPYANGRYWITYNGEVYNFLELRQELEALGHRFRSDSDTEVVAAAYTQWGEGCLPRFNGMWAFGIWDSHQRTLFLARDRFGVKPLYYFAGPRRFEFASEMKAFLPLTTVAHGFDDGAIAAALKDPAAFESSTASLLRGVVRLRPGHWLRLGENGGLRIARWWDLTESLCMVPNTFRGQVEKFQELFFDACRLRMRSDVPIATSLSGGLDSSSVLSAVARGRTNRMPSEKRAAGCQRAFVVGYPGTTHEETEFAKAVLDYHGLPGVFLDIDPAKEIANLDHFLYQTEQTITPHFGAWRLYREMRREGVVVTLDGHGGDEVLGGYSHQIADALRISLDRISRIRRAVELQSVLLGMSRAFRHKPTVIDWLRVARSWGMRKLGPMGRHVQARRKQRSAGTGGATTLAFAGEFLSAGPAPLDAGPPSSVVAEVERRCSPLHAILYRDFHGQTLPAILRSYDLYSMASGVEVRSPFLDWRLVTFCFSIPAPSLVGDGYTKRILREAMKGLLPESVRTRLDKVPFKSPLSDWSNSGLREFVLDSVRSAGFLSSSIWNGRAIAKAVEERSGIWEPRELSVVWRFILMARFIRTFRRSQAGVLAAERRDGSGDSRWPHAAG